MNLANLKERMFRHNIKGKYRFTGRAHGYGKMCILLIGYKQFLWDDILSRFRKFIPSDVDVCLVSSGMHLKELEDIASSHNWSYLSTRRNNVCLAQNIAISLFPEAEYIFKMDEDIFLTEGAFDRLTATMERVDRETPYTVGICAPLLNINAYGYRRILELTGKLNDFESRFGEAEMMSGQKSLIESTPEIAGYMWGEGSPLPSIDELNAAFADTQTYSICPVRLSIGFMVMKRSFWEFIGGFPVVFGNGMGLDETVLIGACSAFSHVVAVAENSVAGHFAYGGAQGKYMKDYYLSHRDRFALPKDSK